MPQRRKYGSRAEKQAAYRLRKRNTEHTQTAHADVTFDGLFASVPTVAPSGSDERYTPRWVLDAARLVLGTIDLDVASNAIAQHTVQALRYYAQADNGLIQPWAGRVWCNPPYSDPLPWVERLIGFHRAGDVPAALLLLNVAATPAWARLLWAGSYPVCLFTNRIQFVKADGTVDGRNNSDQFLWYFGRHRRRFARVFSAYGTIR